MSLWTPGGEHQVPREPRQPEPTAPEGAEYVEVDEGLVRATADQLGVDFDQLTDDQKQEVAAMAHQISESRRAIAEAPAAVVVGNHVMGLYELAAIHLSEDPPNLTEAQVALDAMRAVVEALPGRLGDDEATLREALSQLQLAFVQLNDRGAGGGAD